MKVLVVDDEKVMRELLVDLFELEDHTVAFAEDGLQSLEVYSDFAPEVIILDLMMPKMNGFEVCKKIRTEFHDKKTKIYMLTGKGGADVESEGRTVGADKVLFKPCSASVLLDLLTKND